MNQLIQATELTVGDLFRLFGPINLKRICFDPLPGTATEEDLLAVTQRTERIYELVHGILLEKAVGAPESYLTSVLITMLWNWVSPRNLGAIMGADALERFAPDLVRAPDVSFLFWERFPNRQMPNEPVLGLAPDLAVEVLSRSNTAQEVRQKLEDYFNHGVRLVWVIEPELRTVEVYAALDQDTRLTRTDTLTGEPVLPGFTLSLRSFFAELDPH
jgi:Uma2 family endonuclease